MMSSPDAPGDPHREAYDRSESGGRRLINALSEAVANLTGRRKRPTLPLTGPIFTFQREFSIPAPTRNSLFTFEVSVVDHWKGEGARPNVMQAIERAEPDHRKRLEERVRRMSRRFEPDAFPEAEQYMNGALEQPEIYEMGLLSCYSWVRVGPQEALSRHLQRRWADSFDHSAKHKLAKRHVEHMAELRELWRDFLKDMDGAHVVQAVQLAGNPSMVGQIAKDLGDKKQSDIKALREIMDQAVHDYERLELYDFATSYDSALRELMEQFDTLTSTEGRDR
jgi:hypothetical protein